MRKTEKTEESEPIVNKDDSKKNCWKSNKCFSWQVVFIVNRNMKVCFVWNDFRVWGCKMRLLNENQCINFSGSTYSGKT